MAGLRNAVFFVIFVTGLFVLGRLSGGGSQTAREVPYSELEQDLAAGRAERVVVSDEEVAAYLKAPDSHGAKIVRAERVEPELAQQLARYDVPFSRERSSNALPQLVAWLAPTLIFVGFWYLIEQTAREIDCAVRDLVYAALGPSPRC